MIPLLIKLADQSLKVSALLDSKTSVCFIDKKFTKRYRLSLITKKCHVSVEVIENRPLESGDVMEETISLNIFIGQYQSTVIFNII